MGHIGADHRRRGVIDPGVARQGDRSSGQCGQLFLLALLLASIATVGAALGSKPEDDDVVRAAAYGARQRQRFADAL
jgi:hypothetical protein